MNPFAGLTGKPSKFQSHRFSKQPENLTQAAHHGEGSRHKTTSHEQGGHSDENCGSRWDRLNGFHTVFLVDDSVTMKADWDQALSFLAEVIPECLKHTDSSLSFFFTNRWTATPAQCDGEWNPEWPVPSGHLNVKYVTKDAAIAQGQPEETSAEFIFDTAAPALEASEDPSTTVAKRLGQVLRPYIKAYQAGTTGDERFKYMAQINLIVVTNGADNENLKSETLAVAEDLIECGAPSAQIGIQFVQIGHDKECTQMLKDLDSDMITIYRDMIDTVLYDQTKDPRTGRMTEDGLYKVLLGGVSRKVDMWRLENGHFMGKR